MTESDLVWMIGRATLFTSASALLAGALLIAFRIRSPRIHRVAWLLVIVQGWLLVPWVWQIEKANVEPPAASVRLEPNSEPGIVLPPPILESEIIVQQASSVSVVRLLVATWLLGIVLTVLVRLVHYARFVRHLPAAELAVDSGWKREWQRQLRAARIRRKVELRVTRELGPLVCFVPFRYLVLVPHALWGTLPRRERNVILRHELAHLMRGDLWWSTAIRLLALPQWFNPLVWHSVRRFDEAGEWACDDAVSRGKRNRELAFARSLLATAEYATARSPGTAAIQGGELARRVQRLVSQRFKEDTIVKKLFVLVPLLMIAIVQGIRIEAVAADEPPRPAATAPSAQQAVLRTELPAYVIEPPDVLLINVVKLVPKPPHQIEPFDSLFVRVLGALPDQPIADAFAVDAEGKIDLGPTYGRIDVAGFTLDDARVRIKHYLSEVLQDPQVSVSLAASAGAQQIAGEHLVAPDGRVNLGIYGTVYVSGMTIEEARAAIEKKLSEYLLNPQVVVDVSSYSSKKYYVITRNANGSDNVVMAPITGKDSVLDALATVGNVPQRSNKIWISRAAPHGVGSEQILPVNWEEIVEGKSTATNYQLQAGDRVFVKDVTLSKTEHAKKYRFEIEVIVDPGNELAELDSQRGEATFTTFDSDTIRPTLRILAKHALIKKLSSPVLTCLEGRTMTLQKNSPTDELKLQVLANEIDKGLIVQLGMNAKFEGDSYKFDASIPMQLGETVLIRVNAGDAQTPVEDVPPLYVALTPSILRDSPPQGANKGYFPHQVPPTAE